MTWRLALERRDAGGTTTLIARGRLGRRGAGDLVESVVAAVGAGSRRVVLDLSAVDYASSAGLLALDAVHGRVLAGGGTLVLAGLTEPLRVAMDLAGLGADFLCAPSAAGAVALLPPDAAPRTDAG